MREQIKEARSLGYSDQQILEHLSKKNSRLSPKINEAIKAGYDPTQILGHLAPEPSKFRSIISAPIKGIVKGIGALGELGVPIAFQDEPFEDRQKIIEESSRARQRFEKGPLEKALPTREGFLEEGLERGGEIFPSTVIGPGGLIGAGIRSMIAGLGGRAIKEAGGGPLAQSIGEIMALGAPGLGRKIISSKSQKPLVDFARKMGLTEEEIAPLIQGEKKASFFGSLAKKGRRAESALDKSFKAAGGIFEQLEKSPLAQKLMSPKEVTQFLNETASVLKKLPQAQREKILGEYMDFVRALQSGKGNAAELINLWKDINYHIKEGETALGLLKEPIENAFKRGYPGLNEDFELTRELYKKFFPTAKYLKKGIASQMIDAGEAGALLYGIASGNMSILTTSLGTEAARHLAREMLINPRMQNLRLQMIKALNERKFSVAKSLSDAIISESQKQSQQQYPKKEQSTRKE